MDNKGDFITVLSQMAGSAFFKVDTTKTEVDLSYTDFSERTGFLVDGYLKSIFKKGCNLNILSVGFTLPFGFEFSKVNDDSKYYQSITLSYVEVVGGLKVKLNELIIPMANYELSMGSYYNLAFIGKEYELTAVFSNSPKILMLNIPASFNNLTFYCPIFIKVQMSYDLIVI